MRCGCRQLLSPLLLCLLLSAQARAGAALPGPAPSTVDDGAVVVTLRPSARVSGSPVVLGQIADLSGGDPALRERLAHLDLAELTGAQGETTISRIQVAFRIRVADVDSRRVRVEGAAATRVSLAHPGLDEEDIAAAAREFLLQHLPWDLADVRIELAQPIHGLLRVRSDDDVRLTAEPRSTVTLLGQVRVDVIVHVNGRRQGFVPVYFDVKLYQNVAVVTRRIERGEPLDEEHVQFDRRPVDGVADYVTAREALAGKRAKRLLTPGQLLTALDVEAGGPQGPVLVKQHEIIKIVARVGPLVVTASGEALQEGRAGQVIRVLNVDSKNTILGRVIERSVVEVSY